MRLGARMMKTGLAVAVALYTAALVGIPAPVFAGIAAVFAIKPSIYRSFQTITEQLQANVIGVVTAVLVVITIGKDPIIIGFTAVLIIGICMSLKMSETTVSLAIVALISVMAESNDLPFMEFAVYRFSALTLGILSAFLVNLLFLPPKYEIKLFQKIDRTTSDILQWIRVTTRHLSDDPALKGEINRLQDEIDQIDNIYALFYEERTYLKKNRYLKARKLIVFRQLILATKQAMDVLKAFNRLDEKIESIPHDLQAVLVQEVDKVIHSHEKLILSSMGRIKKDQKETLRSINEPDIPKVVDSLIYIYQNDEENKLIFLPLATELMKYNDELLHLKKLLNSYEQYHQEEHLKIEEHA